MKSAVKTISCIISLFIFISMAAGCGDANQGATGDQGSIHLTNSPNEINDITNVVAPGESDDAPGVSSTGSNTGSVVDSNNSAGAEDSQNIDDDSATDSVSEGAQGSGSSDDNTSVSNASNASNANSGGDADPAANSGSEPSQSVVMDLSKEMLPLTSSPAMFQTINPPDPSGVHVSATEKAEIDYSNIRDGYVMIRFLQSTDRELRVVITGPTGVEYPYTLRRDGSYEVFPLAFGNGSYKIGVFEQVEGNRFATANMLDVDVTLTDQFAPFLRPNQYVNFTPGSRTVAKATELVGSKNSFRERVSIVYDFVIGHLTYDYDLARSVTAGYLPDLDAILARRKGICFDYAALMTAMLRSQGIPTKLVIGYAGDAYHAWIDVYSEATGWLNNVIFFDGRTWNLMDPTYASTGNQSANTMQFIGDGTNYRAMYLF